MSAFICSKDTTLLPNLRRVHVGNFWVTVCKPVRPMPSDRCLSVLWRWCIGAKRLDGSRWNSARR